MLFIWGNGGNRAIAGLASCQKCDCCNEVKDFVAVVDYRYFHLWYLFSFLTSRQYAVVCSQCGNGTLISKSEFKSQYKKDNVPVIRKWGWLICVLIIVAFIGYGKFSSERHQQQVSSYITQPVVNDVYLANLARIDGSGYNSEKYAYGAMKLVNIKNGYYYFMISEAAYTKKKGIDKNLSGIKYAESEDEIVMLSHQEIVSFKNSNIIYEVIRN